MAVASVTLVISCVMANASRFVVMGFGSIFNAMMATWSMEMGVLMSAKHRFPINAVMRIRVFVNITANHWKLKLHILTDRLLPIQVCLVSNSLLNYSISKK